MRVSPCPFPLRTLALAAGLAWPLLPGRAAAADEWLALCAKCVNPSVFSKSGIGTENAVARARITRREVQGWCENWQPGDRGCVASQLAAEDTKKVYEASANCRAGHITAVDGQRYTLAGAWGGGDIGAGRSRWRDAQGRIVGRDNASGGLGISQQWELLCPGPLPGAAAARPPAPSVRPPQAAAASGGAPGGALQPRFAAGQTVMARYGTDWVRARVNKVVRMNGPNGPQYHYDVLLANKQRGVVPERMLRPAQ